MKKAILAVAVYAALASAGTATQKCQQTKLKTQGTLQALLALVTSFAVAGSASANQYSSPNKYVSASSVTGLNLYGIKSTSVDLRVSRRNRMLVVHASAMQDVAATGEQTVGLSVWANGIRLEPGSSTTCAPGDVYRVRNFLSRHGAGRSCPSRSLLQQASSHGGGAWLVDTQWR